MRKAEIARLWLLVRTLPRGDRLRRQCKVRIDALRWRAEERRPQGRRA